MLVYMDEIRKLGRTWKRANAAAEDARKALAQALLEAAEAGTAQKELAEAVGTNREQIRLMVNRARAERAKDHQPANDSPDASIG
jgi:hypothetical protein